MIRAELDPVLNKVVNLAWSSTQKLVWEQVHDWTRSRVHDIIARQVGDKVIDLSVRMFNLIGHNYRNLYNRK